ncbi:MAG: methyltransferase domain-containing protein [Actinomycetia bacterium]|nr:methyltransferase domain-containing protein [Actinomycetes bacterium]
MADRYTHGHSEAVLRSHRWRTAANSAAHLLPHLEAGQRLLDVGCGPGNITGELAGLVEPGEVVGIDMSAEVVAQAEADVGQVENLSLRTADVYELPFKEGDFDVVHAHQVLQHLADPHAALLEMRRVLVDGGVLAVRDSDYGSFMWSPDDPLLDRWIALHHAAATANGADADAGRHLLGWVRDGGFREAVYSSSTWTYATPGECGWWGTLWADRIEGSAFTEQVLGSGLSTRAEIEAIAGAFRRWAVAPNASFVCVHGEVIARK